MGHLLSQRVFCHSAKTANCNFWSARNGQIAVSGRRGTIGSKPDVNPRLDRETGDTTKHKPRSPRSYFPKMTHKNETSFNADDRLGVLTEENEMLRSALMEIKSGIYRDVLGTASMSREDMQEVASAALKYRKESK